MEITIYKTFHTVDIQSLQLITQKDVTLNQKEFKIILFHFKQLDYIHSFNQILPPFARMNDVHRYVFREHQKFIVKKREISPLM